MLAGIIISVLFLTAIGLALAALLLLAERRILRYGDCVIDLNEGKKRFTVPGGGSLLSALADQDIFIPSACGGRGTCAYCKVRVIEGAGPVGPVEEPYLTGEEKNAGVRLSCQVKVRGDLKIAIPEALFSIRRYRGRVAHKKPLTGDILELRIDLEEPPDMEFSAGQYIQLESAPYRGRETVMRAYSISSLPSDRGAVELVIRLVPDGICTTWVFEELEEGGEVFLSGPYGDFRLSDTDAPVVFVAGGSGMAPVWSMLRDMRERKIERDTVYFFGALRRQDLFYLDELRALDKECAWFTFVPALSAEPEDSDWEGERGLITEVLARRLPDASRHEAYLCGSPGMIDAAVKTLNECGLPDERVFYDKFA